MLLARSMNLAASKFDSLWFLGVLVSLVLGWDAVSQTKFQRIIDSNDQVLVACKSNQILYPSRYRRS